MVLEKRLKNMFLSKDRNKKGYTLSGMDGDSMPDFFIKKETFAVPSLYNQFTTKIMKEG